MPSRIDAIHAFYEKYPYPALSEMPLRHLQTYANQILACSGLTTQSLTGKTVLDAGCGTGEIACSMATHAKKVIGIDLSNASLEHARELSKRFGLKNILFEQENILQMSLNAKEKFDLVTAFGVLHHTQDPGKGFELLSSRVKANGIFVVGFYHSLGGWKQRMQKFLVDIFAGKNADERLAFVEHFMHKKLGKHQRAFWADRIANPREKYYRIREMKKMFEENGFNVIGIQAHKPRFRARDVSSRLSIWAFELFLLASGYRFVIMAGRNSAF